MAEANDPNLLVVNCDAQRVQWLTHHVTSRWANAEVRVAPGSAGGLFDGQASDAVLLQIDFGGEDSAARGIALLTQCVQAPSQPYCIVLADHGSEASAVQALRTGARDYLPLANLSGDALLSAIGEAYHRRRDADRAADVRASAADAPPAKAPPRGAPDEPSIHVPGYSIVKAVQTSNFSTVYVARSESLRRNVVLKVMQRGASARELEDAERFQREYQIIASLRDRAIAEIFDFGTLPRHLYLAMEYFPCGDLRDRLRNPLTIEESLFYLRGTAAALRIIHALGIWHRDLKPANVMLREDNTPVLIDFGLARRAMDDIATTGAGLVLGSPYYISPEQAQGRPVDARADLYSLGVMFYEMLTGEKPYVGRNAIAVMKQHARAPVPTLPPAFEEQQPLLKRLMAKDPGARYASAADLLADLVSTH